MKHLKNDLFLSVNSQREKINKYIRNMNNSEFNSLGKCLNFSRCCKPVVFIHFTEKPIHYILT